MNEKRSARTYLTWVVAIVFSCGILVGSWSVPAVAAQRDSDGDRMPDWWERDHHLAVKKRDARFDPDNDGLRNLGEFKNRLDPQSPDSDTDRLTDSEELRSYFTDPHQPDSDADELDDYAEAITYRTYPTHANDTAPDYVLGVAHRGASDYAPENTLPSFDLADRLGAEYVEIDVRATQDGTLVVFHDGMLDRTMRGPPESCNGPVAERMFAQLGECDAGRWFNENHPNRADVSYEGLKAPTLSEVFSTFGQSVNYYAEIKVPGIEEAAVQQIHAHDLTANVIVSSFDANVLRAVRGLDPQIGISQLIAEESAAQVAARLRGISEYADRVSIQQSVASRELVDLAHDTCLRVDPYTVNDWDRMKELFENQVDGIVTDAPNVLNRLMFDLQAAGTPVTQPELSGCA